MHHLLRSANVQILPNNGSILFYEYDCSEEQNKRLRFNLETFSFYWMWIWFLLCDIFVANGFSLMLLLLMTLLLLLQLMTLLLLMLWWWWCVAIRAVENVRVIFFEFGAVHRPLTTNFTCSTLVANVVLTTAVIQYLGPIHTFVFTKQTYFDVELSDILAKTFGCLHYMNSPVTNIHVICSAADIVTPFRLFLDSVAHANNINRSDAGVTIDGLITMVACCACYLILVHFRPSAVRHSMKISRKNKFFVSKK